MGCNRYPKCRTIVSIKKKDELLKLQSEGKWPPKTADETDEILGRKKTADKPDFAGATPGEPIKTTRAKKVKA
jgi:hypothetical protein